MMGRRYVPSLGIGAKHSFVVACSLEFEYKKKAKKKLRLKQLCPPAKWFLNPRRHG